MLNDQPRVFNCRHCGQGNRIQPSVAVVKFEKFRCGSCSENIFYAKTKGFHRISTLAYEHPLDRQALNYLKKVPGTDSILKFIVRELSERKMRMFFQQATIKVHEKHLPMLDAHIKHAAYVLDLEKTPELFVQMDPRPNAFAIGVDDPFVVLTTGLLDLLTESQISGVIGHELGHIHSGHQLYRTALFLIIQLADSAVGKMLPFREAAMSAVYSALLYWNRCSELTADRAGLLVERDFESAIKTEMKLAGGSRYTNDHLDVAQFLIQAEETTKMQEDNFMNKLWSELQVGDSTHPFPVWRAGFMHQWVIEGNYLDILAGNYQKIGADEIPIEEGSSEQKTPSSITEVIDGIRGLFS